MGGATSRYSFLNNTNNSVVVYPNGPNYIVPNSGKQKLPKEKSRYGVVHVKVTSFVFNSRRQTETETNYVISPRGAIFYGSQASPAPVQYALATSSTPVLPPSEIPVVDSRAHRIMITYTNGWYLIPSRDSFSRHSGTCLILGDKTTSSCKYPMKIGDCFRLGSVGVVVTEIKTANGEEQRLDGSTLQFLKDEAVAFENNDEMATLAADEEEAWRKMHDEDDDGRTVDGNHQGGGDDESETVSHGPPPVSYGTGGLTHGERFICYMCYETHNTPDDPLVAPCDCKGDTRYLHVQCLQKWYASTVAGPQSRVLRTTGSGAPACKVCGAAYKTVFKRPDGKVCNLLEGETDGSYITLVVVTRHDTSPGLFNTKFRLNFARDAIVEEIAGTNTSDTLLIGRSSSCNMILDYRTVSTVHAAVVYENGKFFIVDRNSSNGTMVYLKEPLPLRFSRTIRIRMGRTTLAIQPKRSFVATVRSWMHPNANDYDDEEEEEMYGSESSRSSFLSFRRNSSQDRRKRLTRTLSTTKFLDPEELMAILSQNPSKTEVLDTISNSIRSNGGGAQINANPAQNTNEVENNGESPRSNRFGVAISSIQDVLRRSFSGEPGLNQNSLRRVTNSNPSAQGSNSSLDEYHDIASIGRGGSQRSLMAIEHIAEDPENQVDDVRPDVSNRYRLAPTASQDMKIFQSISSYEHNDVGNDGVSVGSQSSRNSLNTPSKSAFVFGGPENMIDHHVDEESTSERIVASSAHHNYQMNSARSAGNRSCGPSSIMSPNVSSNTNRLSEIVDVHTSQDSHTRSSAEEGDHTAAVVPAAGVFYGVPRQI